ncbi:MAG: ATP-binding protein, partial [Alphaproteobacteria bacterium]|nr:ATP-binding protein [Alphaproteobacteria bacterium]
MLKSNDRHLESYIKRVGKFFKIVLIVGARQVGKSTILQKIFPKLDCIVFDNLHDIHRVKKDPDLFLQNHPSPIILDEVQYATELFGSIKRKADKSTKSGQYFLTGSHNLMMLKNVAESMAGRVGIIELSPMTYFELNNRSEQNFLEKFLKNPESLPKKFLGCLHPKKSLYEVLWRGGFPALLRIKNDLVTRYFDSYIQTYLERDVRVFGAASDLGEFNRFLGIVAALTAQEINYSQLGREIGVTPKTSNNWLQAMSNAYLWFELFPFNNNAIKRVSQKRKGHIIDSGLACYLNGIFDAGALAKSPLKGAIFESYCVTMVKALANNLKAKPRFSHYRTNGGAEVDLILEYNGQVYPIEIKLKSYLDHYDKRG